MLACITTHPSAVSQDQIDRKVNTPCNDALRKAREAQRDGVINVDIDTVLKNAEDVGMSPTICYRVQARAPSDVFKSFQISHDPESPTFYSTCYIRQAVVQMDVKSEWWATTSSDKNEESTSPWEFEDRCLSCRDHELMYKHPVPQWRIADTCTDCDWKKNPYSETHAPLDVALVAPGARCDGWPTWVKPDKHHTCNGGTDGDISQKCFKMPFAFRDTTKSNPWGLSWVTSATECGYLTYRDPECSNVFMFDKDADKTCICMRKDECCGGCSAVYATTTISIYDVNSVPDPTCATGVTAQEPEFEFFNPPDSERMFSSILYDAAKGTGQAQSMLVTRMEFLLFDPAQPSALFTKPKL